MHNQLSGEVLLLNVIVDKSVTTMEWHSGKLFAAAALANTGGQAPPTNNV